MVGGSTRTLALLLFEDATSDGSNINPFFLRMIGSIARACASEGYDLLLSFQQIGEDWYAHYEEAHRADGLILLGYGDYTRSRQNLEKLAESGAHFVLWGPVIEGQPGISLGCDNFQGGLEATRHLLARGCRNIAFVGTRSDHAPEFQARYRGHLAALAEAGIDPNDEAQVHAESSELEGAEGAAHILSTLADVDALFCASDMIAIGAMNHLRSAGRDVPGDIAVMGFDDIGAAAYSNPPLSTMRQDTIAAGEAIVATLLNRVNGGDASPDLLVPQLILRDSA